MRQYRPHAPDGHLRFRTLADYLLHRIMPVHFGAWTNGCGLSPDCSKARRSRSDSGQARYHYREPCRWLSDLSGSTSISPSNIPTADFATFAVS